MKPFKIDIDRLRWKKVGSDEVASRTLDAGYKVKIHKEPPNYRVEVFNGDYYNEALEVEWWDVENAVRRLLKEEDRPIVIRLMDSCGNLGSCPHYVVEVTEKVIKTACNDKAVCYYNRETGYRKESVSGLAAVARRGLTGLQGLDEFVKACGTKTATGTRWSNGWSPRYNSRDEVVNHSVPSYTQEYENILKWWKKQGYRVVVLKNTTAN